MKASFPPRGSAFRYRFSIITPTYNRAHLITRTYESLRAQIFEDFEWIVIDDGSIDGTRDLVLSWNASFPIRYFWKPNGGLHTALNLGTSVAEGEFLTQVDSDDYCVPHALERLDYLWRQIPTPERFSHLAGLCRSEDGAILGTPLSRDYIDTFKLRDALRLVDADRWGVVRTNIARQFPYPVFKNERFIMPGLVHNRILSRYAVRYFNEALLVVTPTPGQMSSRDLRWSNPKGAALYHRELAMLDVPLKMRLKSAIYAMLFSALAAGHALVDH